LVAPLLLVAGARTAIHSLPGSERETHRDESPMNFRLTIEIE
jgi:hypothetical protein